MNPTQDAALLITGWLPDHAPDWMLGTAICAGILAVLFSLFGIAALGAWLLERFAQ